MTAGIHTLVYPSSSGASIARLEFDSKSAGPTMRHYKIDFTGFAAGISSRVSSVAVLADPSLTLGDVSWNATTVFLLVSGGRVTTPMPVISFAVVMDNGSVENFDVVQPISALTLPIPASAVTLGQLALTTAGQPIDVAAMIPPPGGLVLGDGVLVYRAGTGGAVGNVYLIPAADLGGGGGGTTVADAVVFAGVPVTFAGVPVVFTPGGGSGLPGSNAVQFGSGAVTFNGQPVVFGH